MTHTTLYFTSLSPTQLIVFIKRIIDKHPEVELVIIYQQMPAPAVSKLEEKLA